jgi:hypothetical protein
MKEVFHRKPKGCHDVIAERVLASILCSMPLEPIDGVLIGKGPRVVC